MLVRNSAILFSMVVPIALLGFWLTELYLQAVPEVYAAPVLTVFHLSAELFTISLVFFGSIALVQRISWGVRLHAVALGLLCYSSLYNAGYFAQAKSWWEFSCFLIVALLSIYFTINVIFRRKEFHIKEPSSQRRPRSSTRSATD